jgi:hypothetical protein
MPSINRDFNGTEHKLLKIRCEGRERVKPSLTWPVQEHPLCFSILDQEEIMVKSNKGVIIKGKVMNRDEILVSRRNMKNMIESKIMNRDGNNGFTNMSNVHT